MSLKPGMILRIYRDIDSEEQLDLISRAKEHKIIEASINGIEMRFRAESYSTTYSDGKEFLEIDLSAIDKEKNKRPDIYREIAEDRWHELVKKHTVKGSCNFQLAAIELAEIVGKEVLGSNKNRS